MQYKFVTYPLTFFTILLAASCKKTVDQISYSESNITYSYDSSLEAKDYSPLENLFITMTKFNNEVPSFFCHGYGQVIASFYKQNVDTIRQKNTNYCFYQTIATSALVNVAEQYYFQDDIVISRKAESISEKIWSKNYQMHTVDSFIQRFAWHPAEFSHFIINPSSILSADLVKQQEDTYTFRYILDNEKATPKYKIKMKETGELADYPKFSKIEMQLTIQKNWLPIQIVCKEKYVIQKGILSLQATSNLTEEFTYLNQNFWEDMVFFENILNR